MIKYIKDLDDTIRYLESFGSKFNVIEGSLTKAQYKLEGGSLEEVKDCLKEYESSKWDIYEVARYSEGVEYFIPEYIKLLEQSIYPTESVCSIWIKPSN